MKKYVGNCPNCGTTTTAVRRTNKKTITKCLTCGRTEGIKITET